MEKDFSDFYVLSDNALEDTSDGMSFRACEKSRGDRRFREISQSLRSFEMTSQGVIRQNLSFDI